MATANSGGSVHDDDYLDRRYVANEDDRERTRQLYIPLAGGAVDWSPQSYQVYDDEVLLAVAGANCGRWFGTGIARPDPHTDVFAVAEDLGQVYGNCPASWATPPVTLPDPLDLYVDAILRVRFTLDNLGDGSGTVDWRVEFTHSPTSGRCTAPACTVLYSSSSTIGANSPYEHREIDLGVPIVAVGDDTFGSSWIPGTRRRKPTRTTNIAIWNQEVHVLGVAPCGCQTPPSPAGTLWAGGILAAAVGARRRRPQA